MIREFKNEYDAEFTDEQLNRIDEVDNAAYNFARVLTELAYEGDEHGNKELPWSMSFIGEIVDSSIEIMERNGYKVRYPFFVTDNKTGKTISCDYNDEAK